MNIGKKKILASKVLGVGKGRIAFSKARLNEIKEAITKQDIRDLFAAGAIAIKEVKGRKKIVGRKRRRGPGKVQLKVNIRKRTYMTMTRKLRGHVFSLRNQGTLSLEDYRDLRKKIRNRFFKSKAHLKEHLGARASSPVSLEGKSFASSLVSPARKRNKK